jgi:hypothetical protein
MPEVKTDALALPSPEKIELKVEGQSTKLTRLAAFTPTNLSEAMALAKMIAQSDLAPKDYKGKPGNVLIAMQFGAELGVAPMQSVQNIAVINGRPSLWEISRSPWYRRILSTSGTKNITREKARVNSPFARLSAKGMS